MTADLSANQAYAALQRGIGYSKRGQWQQAINALQSAVEDPSTFLDARYELALCYGMMGRVRDARTMLESGLNAENLDDANKVKYLKLFSKVAMQAADYHLAAHCLEEAYDITGIGGAPILNNLGQVHCKSGDFERGFQLFFRAMEHM
jgi:Tfp pilus assembly protein PilF